MVYSTIVGSLSKLLVEFDFKFENLFVSKPLIWQLPWQLLLLKIEKHIKHGNQIIFPRGTYAFLSNLRKSTYYSPTFIWYYLARCFLRIYPSSIPPCEDLFCLGTSSQPKSQLMRQRRSLHYSHRRNLARHYLV